ncbi:FeoB small GTPase domain-containing protein [Spirochaetota bacterium]
MDLQKRDLSENSNENFMLLGNINTGKSTIFNKLSSKNVREGNYSGTTVSISSSMIPVDDKNVWLIDTPGADTIYGENEDEIISKKMIFDSIAGNIVFVADAKSMKRSLALFFHYLEYDLPSIFNINMMDEALIHNIDINVDKLSQILGIEINTSVAIEGDGISSLKKKLSKAKKVKAPIKYPEFINNYFHQAAQILKGQSVSRGILLSLVLDDKPGWEYVKIKCGNTIFSQLQELVLQAVKNSRNYTNKRMDILLLDLYMDEADRVYNETVKEIPGKKLPFADKFGMWSRNLSTGIPIAIVIIFFMFLFVGKFGAEFLVGLIEGELFLKIIIPFFKKICVLVPYKIFSRLIVGEFGLLSVGLSLAIGIVMPVLLTFYFFFGIIENSGYLPRLAILLNRMSKIIGISGKGILPLIMGFSCTTMAILTTRALDTDKEKNIATFLLVQGIPCAPLLSVMLVLLAVMPLWTYFFLFGIIVLKLFLTGYLVNKIFRGREPDFIMQVPPLRIPKLKGILINSFRRTFLFLKEAIPVFLIATFAVFILDEVGGLDAIESAAEPVISGFIGLPKESVNVLLMSFIRREAGVALLTEFVKKGLFSNIQIIVNLLLISFLIPCINAIIVMFKERGAKVATSICIFVVVYAVLLGAGVNRLLIFMKKTGII